MKIPIQTLNLNNIQILKEQNSWDDHFNIVVWPRVLFWLGLKEQFSAFASLDWKIHYTPNNMHNNFVSMHIVDPKKVFNFYFQIPLVEKLSFHLYLGDSTYNFFEIHPLIIKMGLIKREEFEVKATSATLPRLVLSTPTSKYDKKTLWSITVENYTDVVKQDPIITLLNSNFKRFVPELTKIIEGEWKL